MHIKGKMLKVTARLTVCLVSVLTHLHSDLVTRYYAKVVLYRRIVSRSQTIQT